MGALPVMEQFYTLQGEGAFAGHAAWFIRLAGCDVGCVWCDVKDSWDAERWPRIEVKELVSSAVNSGTSIVVVTGGEPAMYDLNELTEALSARGLQVHIETSAAHPVRGKFDWITLSPKKFKAPLESELSKADELKIVVYNKSDFKWAETYASAVSKHCKLLLQPEWDKRDTMTPEIVEYIKEHPNWALSLQTHKYIGLP